jgi:hypothetical protein
MNISEFDDCYPRWARHIIALSRRLARGDADWAEDLAQEGRWKLAEFDLACVTRNQEACIWRVLRDHMLNVYRRELRAKIITPPRRRRPGPRPMSGGRVQMKAGYRIRRRVCEPRHLDAGPLDDDAGDALWDDV